MWYKNRVKNDNLFLNSLFYLMNKEISTLGNNIQTPDEQVGRYVFRFQAM